MSIILTAVQKSILDGEQGETMARVMQTLVRYGELLGAKSMAELSPVPGHLSMGYGLKALRPAQEILERLIAGKALPGQPFTADPRPFDSSIPCGLLPKAMSHFLFSGQKEYELLLSRLGHSEKISFHCACCPDASEKLPSMGDILSWSRDSAVVYANSVLGARCNRSSAVIGLFGSIAGCVPRYGLLTDGGRRATRIVKLQTSYLPDPQLLGAAIGAEAAGEVPYIRGLDKWLDTDMTPGTLSYLRDLGAAAAAVSPLGLFHAAGITPEAKELEQRLVIAGAKTCVIKDEDISGARKSLQDRSPGREGLPSMCFSGCPHLSLSRLADWTERLTAALAAEGRSKTAFPLVLSASPKSLEQFRSGPEAAKLRAAGVTLTSVCPLMYLQNPFLRKETVLTDSVELSAGTSTVYCPEDEILRLLTKGGDKT